MKQSSRTILVIKVRIRYYVSQRLMYWFIIENEWYTLIQMQCQLQIEIHI